MNKNTKSQLASAHKIFRGSRRDTSAKPLDPRCQGYQSRKSTQPKVACSAAEISKKND